MRRAVFVQDVLPAGDRLPGGQGPGRAARRQLRGVDDAVPVRLCEEAGGVAVGAGARNHLLTANLYATTSPAEFYHNQQVTTDRA